MTPPMASEKMSKSQICCFYSVSWADQFKSEKKKTLKSLHQPEEFTIEDKDVKNMIIFVWDGQTAFEGNRKTLSE